MDFSLFKFLQDLELVGVTCSRISDELYKYFWLKAPNLNLLKLWNIAVTLCVQSVWKFKA